MPRLRKPESAIDRLALLKRAEETATTDIEKGETYLTEQTLSRISMFIPKLETAMGKLGSSNSLSQKERREKNNSMSVLQTYMRDIWEGQRRRVYRENLPLEVFAYYQLPQSGKTPELNQEGQWLETAALIIEGETAAITAGYKPVTNPDLTELKEKLELAKNESSDVANADKQLDEAQEAVSDLMPEAKSIIDRVIAELDFHLYEKDDAGKRRIMRNYGVRYEYTKNEVPEEETDLSTN